MRSQPTNSSAEYIVAAAYRYEGVNYIGKNHADVVARNPLTKLVTFSNGSKGRKNLHFLGEDGFVTNKGRFVDRKEAARIAIISGQITRLRFLPCGELDSSDLNEPDLGEEAHCKTPEDLLALLPSNT